MKIRTVYFKVPEMRPAVEFWSQFLEVKPHKNSEYWAEFKCANVNLGLLWMEEFKVDQDRSNFVPVFEFTDVELASRKERALALGARVLVDIADHPDGKSYVLADPVGHEFEITKFHD